MLLEHRFSDTNHHTCSLAETFRRVLYVSHSLAKPALKIITQSTNNKFVIEIEETFTPWEFSFAFMISLFRPSITIKNNKGELGHL